MYQSLVASYNDDDLLATSKTTADDNFDTNHLFYQSFAKYAELYQQYPALRFGEQAVVYSQNEAGIFAITRQIKATDKTEAQSILVVFNTATNAQSLNAISEKTGVKQAESTLLYRSVESSKTDEISPLSFAIYQLK